MATIPPRRREVWLRQLVRKWGGLSNTGSCCFNHDTDSSVLLNTDDTTTLFDYGKELEELREFDLQDTGATEFRVHTWNVAGKPPPDDLDMEGWISSSSLPADIYVFGFQEVVPLNASNVLSVEDEGPAARWEAKIRETLNKPRSISALKSSTSVPLSPHRHGDDDDHDNVVVTDVPEVSNVHKLLAELSGSKLLLRSANEWTTAFVAPPESPRHGAGPMYSRVASKQMVGLFITVWIRSHLWHHVHNVQVSTVGCGLMNHLGNKGSISVSMFLHHTSFCFVCSHLTSGHKDGDALRRNADVAEILRRTKFPRLAKLLGLGLPETILAHERVIWLGDLNYRLALPDKETWTLVKRGDWATLLRMDQLKLEQGEGRVFPDWQEGPIYFPPTYKYMNGSDEYYDGANPNGGAASEGSSKRRSPAWCDRVLWYGEGLQQLDYNREDSRLSDHRSVSATFTAEVEMVSRKKLKKRLVRSTVVPMVKPLIDIHKLPSNELWSSLMTTLTPQRHKLSELELDTSGSDSNESLHEGEDLKHITVLVDEVELNLLLQQKMKQLL